MVTATKLGETVVAGNDYALVFTLTKDGATYDITGATVTCSIRAVGRKEDNIADHSVSITTAASGIATLTLLDTETATLSQPRADEMTNAILHIGDVKVEESGGNFLHCGPFSFEVRRGIT